MPVNVLMPQMGESITEGTIVRWFKQEGETVSKDEPLLEISTDKVDAEVPAPASGVLAKIVHGPGATVPVETVIGTIAGAAEAVAATPTAAAAPAPVERPAPAATPAAVSASAASPAPIAPPAPPPTSEAALLRQRSSPLVRRIAEEHSVDLAQVAGTGAQGRVTKDDITAFIERRKAAPVPPTPARAAAPASTLVSGATLAPSGPFTGEQLREPMSIMRQKIAEHMVASRRTSPHVHTVFEADLSRVVALQHSQKDAFLATNGLKLTYTPFFLAAALEALKAFPVVNASVEGNEIVYHRHVNLGVAVALPHGLIVPVIRHAEELSFIGLQRAVTDLAARARNKQLKPEDVGGSTFSVTNPGPYGGLFGLPIINQPNVAILSIGGIQRRPVVATDELGREAIAIRAMVYLALSFDHRLVDGATADQFMAALKVALEKADFDLV
jgi:2-oxoglutarate dehydrogenase E2 component (dihydrolipoamide succinyltransferase)